MRVPGAGGPVGAGAGAETGVGRAPPEDSSAPFCSAAAAWPVSRAIAASLRAFCRSSPAR